MLINDLVQGVSASRPYEPLAELASRSGTVEVAPLLAPAPATFAATLSRPLRRTGGMRSSRLAVAAALLALLLAATGASAGTSRLWGRNGEQWRPTGRLPDWSYVGQGAGKLRFPTYRKVFNVRAYGARGDGSDATNAILTAIRHASLYSYTINTVRCSGAPKSPQNATAASSTAGAGAGAGGGGGASAPFMINQPGRCLKWHNGFQNNGRDGAVVLIPQGRYKITRMLEITQSNVIVRGAGVGKTVLYFPEGLKRIYGNKMEWQWSGGFLTMVGPEINSTHREFKLANVTQDARKGARRLSVSSTKGIAKGSWVRIWAEQPQDRFPLRRSLLGSLPEQPGSTAATAGAGVELSPRERQQRLLAQHRRWETVRRNERRLQQRAPDGFLPLSPAAEEAAAQAAALGLGIESLEVGGGGVGIASKSGTLDAYIYGENAVSSGREPFPLERIRFVSKVAAVGNGLIELERPLPYDLRTKWKPVIHSFQQAVQHSGWEDFTIEFEWALYPSHFVVEGFNGIYFTGVANCWARNIHIINADTGGEAINSDFITMQSIKLTHTKPRTGRGMRQGMNGHHGLWAAHSSNVLIAKANVSTQFIHDLTLDVWAQECVIKNCSGIDINLDMHRGGSHNNLWSNINLGRGSRPFASSGDSKRGAHGAANNTWWNIRAPGLNIPDCGYGPLLVFVGPQLGPPADPRIRAAPANQTVGPPANQTVTPTQAATSRMLNYCLSGVNWHVEQVVRLEPADLHGAMRNTRKARIGVP